MLCREQGIGVLWATHLIDEAAADARIVVLHQGRVLASGTRGEVIEGTGAADLAGAFDRLTRPPAAVSA